MNKRILIVDDDRDTASVVTEALRQRGFDASAVYSARECLERVASESVAIVVTDVQMPGRSGIQLCRELHETIQDPLTLVLTGQNNVRILGAAMLAGAYDFITKPVTMDALSRALTRALEHLERRVATATGDQDDVQDTVRTPMILT